MKPSLGPYTGIQSNDELLGAGLNGYRSAVALLASAARTTTTTTTSFDPAGFDTVTVILNVSVASGTGGLAVRLEFQDPVSGNWYVAP